MAARIPGFPDIFLARDAISAPPPDTLIARDGWMTLQRFFLSVPRPRPGEKPLVLPWRHRRRVPPAWKNHVLFYRQTTSADAAAEAPATELLICGVFYVAVDCAERILRELSRTRRHPAATALRTRCVFTFREAPWVSDRGGFFENRVLAAFFREYGVDSEPMSLREFEACPDFSGTAFVDLSSSRLCSLSWITETLQTRGARPLLPSTRMLNRPAGWRSASFRLSATRALEILAPPAADRELSPEELVESWLRSGSSPG